MEMENNDFRVPMQMVSNRDRLDTINVVFYGRVSTQHEQQLGAFDNQMDWYKMLLQNHPNWKVVGEYSDRGITGTDAKMRKGFQKMYHDAEKAVINGDGKPFDLIVTREVCRFSRNTVDSLSYVRKYKKLGIEIFFFNDGIWSCDSDGELRLTLMSGFAQDEARKTSERVNSGHEACRAKGVLFGNGNILGYDLIRNEDTTKNTYVQNSDADTIRAIYKWYMEGLGEKAIVTKLIEGGFTNTIGKVSWTASYISRIISNKTYAGYKGYFKSRTIDFLEHSRENLDEESHMYIKGDWEPIIPLEDWNKVQRIRMSKRRESVTGHNRGKGKKQAKDKWCKKLLCDCGRTYKRYKWRTNENGVARYGYQCRNTLENRKRSFRIANGLSGEGYCDMASIPEWKLAYQLKNIMEYFWQEPKEIIEELYNIIEEEYTEEETRVEQRQIERLEGEKRRLEIRLDSLMDKWLDGNIPDDKYNRKKNELNIQLDNINQQLGSLAEPAAEGIHEIPAEKRKQKLLEIRESLDEMIDLSKDNISEDFIGQMVVRITPTEQNVYRWYMNLGGNGELPIKFLKKDYILLEEITLGFDKAREYRLQNGSYLRSSQWKDIKVQIYVLK